MSGVSAAELRDRTAARGAAAAAAPAGAAASAAEMSAAVPTVETPAATTGVAAGASDEGETVPPEFECSICMKILLLPVTTPCGHNFCRACIEQALRYRPMCPLCRAPLLHCAVPVGGGTGRTTLCVNTLLQQLLEAQYPRMMAARTAEAAAAAEAARQRRSVARNDEIEQQPQEHQNQILPLFFAMGNLLQQQLQQPHSCRSPLSLQATPLVPGETCTLHVHEERYIHLVQLVLQGSHHFGIVLPPVEAQTVGTALPHPPATQGGPSLSPDRAAEAAAPGAETRRSAAASAEAGERLATSAEAGVFGCCVKIEQHSLVDGGPNGGTHPGACVIRCVCKNRFRLVDVILQQQTELDEQQQQQQQQQEQQGQQPPGQQGQREQEQRQQQQPQQQLQLQQQDNEPFEARLAAAIASPFFSVGICHPVVDDLLLPASRATATDPAAAPAEAPEAADSTEGQRQLAAVTAAADEWASSPVSGTSNLAEEFAAVKDLLARHVGVGDAHSALSTNLKLVAARRLCDICVEGLHRQLAQGGEVAQRLFSSKYGRIPVVPERAGSHELSSLSFFFCKVVVANPITRWQWFLTTNILDRLLGVSKVIADAHWMNILNLSSAPPSSLSRFLLLQDIHSNFWLFGLVLLLLLACRSFPSLFFDNEL